MPLELAVFISGNGSNLQAIIDASAAGTLNAKITVVISNRSDAYGLERAKAAGIPTEILELKRYRNATGGSRQDYDAALATILTQRYPQVTCIALAGWMHILSPTFLHNFPGDVLNIHPSLLPAFPGVDAVGQALAYGVQYTGVTVHYVDEGVDTGKIILQEPVPILPNDTKETLLARVHDVEHRLYPEALQTLASNIHP